MTIQTRYCKLINKTLEYPYRCGFNMGGEQGTLCSHPNRSEDFCYVETAEHAQTPAKCTKPRTQTQTKTQGVQELSPEEKLLAVITGNKP